MPNWVVNVQHGYRWVPRRRQSLTENAHRIEVVLDRASLEKTGHLGNFHPNVVDRVLDAIDSRLDLRPPRLEDRGDILQDGDTSSRVCRKLV